MAKGGSHLRRDPQPPRRTESRENKEPTETRRTERRTEARPEARVQSRSERRTENQAPRRSENRPQSRTENRPQEKSPNRADSRPQSPAPRRSESRPQSPAPRRSESRPETQPPKRPEPRADKRIYVQPPQSDGRRTAPPPPRKKPPRRRHRGGFSLWPVIVVLVLVIAFSLFMLGKTILGYTSNRADYKVVQDTAIIPRLPETTPETGTEEADTTEVVRSEIPFDVDWDMLRQTNSEIVAWLYCPDTVINYPVVQSTDNDKYLTVNFSGNYNVGGALFADYTSVIGIRSSHLIIYGHNMKDSSMFGTLQKFADEAYVAEHPVFYLLTPDQAYRVDLLDCLTIGATVDNYPNYFSESGSLESYVGRLSSMAYWVNSEADYQNHQLLTMSTCTGSDDERLILQGVLVPIE